MIEEVLKYWQIIVFLMPLGIIGIWRWSVWLLKKVLSFFYKTPGGNFYSSLSIVTPVYNEDPEMFRLALQSWKSNDPDEIIAVIDHSNSELIGIFESFAKSFFGAKLVVTHTPGKRAALADGARVSNGEIIALVDSDTIWSPDIKMKLLAPFSDPKVGGLTTRQDALKTDTFSRKLFKIMLDDRYLLEYPFLSVVSNSMLCLSGRTAVYRRSAIIDKLDDLVGETFWGKKMISGDDKTLTNLVHADGWKTVFLRDVKVFTPGTPKLSTFLQQKLRWARNGLRSDLKILFSGWIWKRDRILALYMIDKVIAAITVLLAPAYFAVSLYAEYWTAAAIIFGWWMISRMVKIFPHLREKPLDIFLLPAYVAMTFVMAIIKIYAFFTIDKQGWITRWDTNRLSRLNPFRQATSLLLTLSFVGGYFFAVASYQYQVLTRPDLIKEPKASASAGIISEKPRLLSDVQLASKKQVILDYKNKYSYGYYIIKSGDTLPGLQRKFNLSSISSIRHENNVPIFSANNISVGAKVMIPATEMQNALDANTLLLSSSARFVPLLVTYDSITNTIFVRGEGGVATLTKIRRLLGPNSTALQQIKPGEWILRANLDIRKDVTLVLDKRDVTYLKLKSNPDGFVWLRSQNGNILISNTKITSWDETKNAPDGVDSDGRSYITAKISGRMDVINSEIGYLGYVGSPRRGGPFGGSYGLSWKINSRKFNDNLLTGSVINSKIHDNYFGIYTFGATGLIIKNNDVFNNVQYGIDPHDDSNNFIISENRTYENGNHGIILSKRCFNNEISDNISYRNKLHGIMLDKSSNNNIVTGNLVYGNVDGVAIYESNYNLISGNTSKENKQGIRLNNNSAFNYVEKNQISSNLTGLHVYGGASNNIATDNTIKTNELGLSIQDATGNIFYGNFKTLDNVKDGNIKVGLDQNEIKL